MAKDVTKSGGGNAHQRAVACSPVDVIAAIREHAKVIASLPVMVPLIRRTARAMCDALAWGGKVFWFGNGGSAADSQHLAAELVGKLSRERRSGLLKALLPKDL